MLALHCCSTQVHLLVSVCLWQNGRTDGDAIRVWTRVGPMNHVLGRGPDPSRKRGNFEGAPCLLSKFCDHSLRRCLFEHSKLQHPWVVVKNAADDVRAVWFVVWRITDDEKRSRFSYFYLTSQLFYLTAVCFICPAVAVCVYVAVQLHGEVPRRCTV